MHRLPSICFNISKINKKDYNIKPIIQNNNNSPKKCSLKESSNHESHCDHCNMSIIDGVLVVDPSISSLESERKIQRTFTGWKKTNHDYVIEFLKKEDNSNLQMLDIGAGSHNLSEIYTEIDTDHYYTLDIDNKTYVDIVCDLTIHQPLTETFDVIICLNVLEHVFELDDFLTNSLRMLKQGGHFVFAVPYQSGMHYMPHDYFRPSYLALTKLLSNHGLEEQHIEAVHMGYSPWSSITTYKRILKSKPSLLSLISNTILDIIILSMRVIYKINGKIVIQGNYSAEDEANKSANPELNFKATPIGFNGIFKKM